MKFDIKQKPAFDPITFTLTLETPEELRSFLARLGVPEGLALSEYYAGEGLGANFHDLWNELDIIATDRKVWN